MPPYPCPCCGYLVFPDPPGSYDFCPVRGWEDDLSQLRFPAMGGAQAPLARCQEAVTESAIGDAERGGFGRDPHWRPLDTKSDVVEFPEPAGN